MIKYYADKIKVAEIDNTPLSLPNISITIQKLEKQKETQAEAAKKEEENISRANALKEKIHDIKLTQNVQKLAVDESIENAVNNLISMFPNDVIYRFTCHYYTKIMFCSGIDKEEMSKKWSNSITFSSELENYKIILSNQYQKSDTQTCNLLRDFSHILAKRFNIGSEELIKTTWGIVNYFFLKRYSQRWLDICCTGKIKNRNLEEYLLDCFNDEMISINDSESIALFTYYYCTTVGQKDGDKFYLKQPTLETYNLVIDLLNKYEANRKSDNFETKLFGNKFTERKKVVCTIDDVDEMTGTEFEILIANLFQSMKFVTQLTKASGDQGIDVIAEKNGIKYGIQTKCYSGSVGNSAIQEAVAGKQFYGLDKVFVVTNNKFTKAAIKLAQSNDVILWDRTILSEKLMLLK